jgi:hypothetical protein
MRNASAAIVPLFLAIMLLFWLIWFLGGESDNLHKTTQLTSLHKIQDKLLEAAIVRRYELSAKNKELYSEKAGAKKDALDTKISNDNHIMMQKNKIDD